MTARRKGSGAASAAFVLHRYDWSESSLILDLFTREHGRVAAVAKGAKKPYSQLRAVLLPFQRVQVLLGRTQTEGADEVQTLRSAEYAGAAAVLGGAALFSGFYLNELLMKLLPRHDAHPRLFDAYAGTLAALAAAPEREAQAALRAFELVLLREVGVLPELGLTTTTQQPVLPARTYALRTEAGLEACAADDPQAVPGAWWCAAQVALDRDDLAALAATCSLAAAPLKHQLRAQLHYHLGSATLRTRQVMRDVRRLLEPAPR